MGKYSMNPGFRYIRVSEHGRGRTCLHPYVPRFRDGILRPFVDYRPIRDPFEPRNARPSRVIRLLVEYH